MKRLVGERRAIAATVLAFYGLMYTLVALSGATGPMSKVFAALGGVYSLAFFGVVAGYFWARWFASGVSLFGLIMGAIGLWQIGPILEVNILVGAHLAAVLCLWGDSMSELFDGQKAWRERLSMDEHSVTRLGNAITRTGVSLPMILIWALSPRAGGLAVAGAGMAMLAVAGLVRLRTWSVLAMVGAAGFLIGSVAVAPSASMAFAPAVYPGPFGAPLVVFAAGTLLAGALPFFGPIRRYFRTV
jgi:hypothetical protein